MALAWCLIRRSVDIVYLETDMEIRNYYGWVLPNSNEEIIELGDSLEISADPKRNIEKEGRPILDLDGTPIERMISGIFHFKSKELHFTRMLLPAANNFGALAPDLTLEDCIVEILVQSDSGGVSSIIQALTPSVNNFTAGDWQLVEDDWCLDNYNISCSTGGAFFRNSSVAFDNVKGQKEKAPTWVAINTLFKLVEVSVMRVSLPSVFLLALSLETDIIYFPHDVGMDKSVCKKFPIRVDTSILDPGRSFPPSLVVDFRRIQECIQIDGNHTVHISDLILRNLLFFRWWPDMFPFLEGGEGATIKMENVIVELDIDQSFFGNALDAMVKDIQKLNRVPGLGKGKQRLTRWNPKQCKQYQQRSLVCRTKGRCSREAECRLGAIFIEDASFELDGNQSKENVGVKYHIMHSLFTIVTYLHGLDEIPIEPPSSPPSNRLPPSSKAGKNTNSASTAQKTSKQKQQENLTVLLPVLFSVIVALLIILVVCAALVMRHKRQLKVAQYNVSLGGGKASNNGQGTLVGEPPGSVSGTGSTRWGTPTPPVVVTEMTEEQDYQIAANKVLGSVSLGPLLGMGSFGRVYKATWNGATVAVKVISHSGGSTTFAHREAIISTDLHHPNVVQTFLQTTRNFEGSGSIARSETVTSTGSLGRTMDSARSSFESSHDETAKQRDAGYVELGKLRRNTKKRGSSGGGGLNGGTDGVGRSQRGSTGCDDGWDVMSGISVSSETWLVQEWCDQGSLERALDQKKFMIDALTLDMMMVVDTCLDICRGMTYLKNRNIIHGDLKTSNVLLSGSLHEYKRFSAKVADFGLSRQLAVNASHVKTRTTGTVTHMPPELFKEERLTTASDVYSFGIVMWELVSGEAPLEGVPHYVVMKKVLLDNWRPTFPSNTPESYKLLAEQCWTSLPDDRPSFENISEILSEMRAGLSPAPGRSR
ncbi:hypothetical protein BSKO_12563 [Bryopsis sp. KO-2023]|nr:hypothetical protein BSKO_12563 [Bryopsis sp. KO-2023]